MLSEWKSTRGGWEEEERQRKVGREGRYKRRDRREGIPLI